MANMTDNLLVIIVLIMFLGYIWAIPRDTVYNAIVTLVAAAISVGWLSTHARRKK
jgi:hypothetical protein